MKRKYSRHTQKTVDDFRDHFQRELDAMTFDYMSRAAFMSEAAMRNDLRAIHEHYNKPTFMTRAGKRLSRIGHMVVEIGDFLQERGQRPAGNGDDLSLDPTRYSVRDSALDNMPAGTGQVKSAQLTPRAQQAKDLMDDIINQQSDTEDETEDSQK